MNHLHFAWLEAAIVLPLVGALVVARFRDPVRARQFSSVISGVALFCTVGAWQDFFTLHAEVANDRWDLVSQLCGARYLVIDEFSAPLLPLVAMLYFLTVLATLSTKLKRFSFAWTLVSESIALATFSTSEPRLLIVLLALGAIPPFFELRHRQRPTMVYSLHMALFVGLLMLGWYFVEAEGATSRVHSLMALLPLLLAMLIRNGMAPFHCWMSDLFEHATFGTALLYATPLVGAYATVRLVLPVAPDWILRSMGLIAIFTAVYCSGMALIQREARRFYTYLFLSHSAQVLVGLEAATSLGLTGGLCVWLSVSLALGGFGLTLRALEARRGRLSLVEYQGLYEHAPALAVFFILTGLASVGFPGTFGFVGTELLIDGAVAAYPFMGMAVVLAAALNGIAFVQAYFKLFTGTSYSSSVSLKIGRREKFAVLTLAALILGGGIFPQPGVASRHHAAIHILDHRFNQSGKAHEGVHHEHEAVDPAGSSPLAE